MAVNLKKKREEESRIGKSKCKATSPEYQHALALVYPHSRSHCPTLFFESPLTLNSSMLQVIHIIRSVRCSPKKSRGTEMYAT
jgi:hypothetical protein